jgi:hypothetical protein
LSASSPRALRKRIGVSLVEGEAEPLLAVARREDLVPLELEVPDQPQEDSGVILDDEDPRHHPLLPVVPPRAGSPG